MAQTLIQKRESSIQVVSGLLNAHFDAVHVSWPPATIQTNQTNHHSFAEVYPKRKLHTRPKLTKRFAFNIPILKGELQFPCVISIATHPDSAMFCSSQVTATPVQQFCTSTLHCPNYASLSVPRQRRFGPTPSLALPWHWRHFSVATAHT